MTVIAPAFADPVLGSQAVFRAVMQATARPGTVERIDPRIDAPAPLRAATAALALTLLDYETPVWLDPLLAASRDLIDWISFHTGAPRTDDPRQAAFAFIADPEQCPPFEGFALGSNDYPDRSTTVVLQVDGFSGGERIVCTGPGIAAKCVLRAAPLPPDFAQQLAANRVLFPRGVDLILATEHEIAALPRSVRVLTERG
jgi:alpha-D-ribose 1-methylphosphonate 5-triphosphate synthase subunit PhnH